MPDPLFKVSNHHSASCGQPPAVDGDASGNKYLSSEYARLLDQGLRMLRIPFGFDPQGEDDISSHLAKIVSEHRAMTAAINTRDADRAEQLAQAHTELFQTRLLQYLQQNDARAVDADTSIQASCRPGGRHVAGGR